jgi:hypothetical protein
MICDECETVAHCLKNGCVPKKQPALKPLTDEQIKAVIAKIDPNEHYLPNALRQLARAIEAAHGITKGQP